MAINANKKADPLEGLAGFVDEAMQQWKVPGVAVGVVKDGQVILCQGFGLRDVDRNLPVTPETVFALASVSKAFTNLSVGILVDDGRLAWDTPVRDYIPSFQMYDPVATERLTIRDMLCHRSGLPRHDGLRANTALTRKDMFERLRYLEPSKDIRTTYQYNNLMYISAGQIVEELTGSTWEEVVQTRILDVIGMTGTWTGVPDLARLTNYAQQYKVADGKFEAFPYGRRTRATAPCGGIYSNVQDMSKWLLFHLGNGEWNGARIVSKGTLDEVHTPQMIVRGGESIPGLEKFTELGQRLYALGWAVDQYRGHTLVSHGGSVEGIATLAAFMPNDRIGCVVLCNMDASLLPTVVAHNVFDRLLGLDILPWSQRLGAIFGEVMKGMAAGQQAAAGARQPNTMPSRPLEAFEGEYTHPGYGTLVVLAENGLLKGRIATTEMVFRHHHYDVFDTTISLFSGVETQATFYAGPDGIVESVAMPLEPLVSPVTFRRSAPASMTESAFLTQFVGEYEFMGLPASVFLAGGRTLMVTVPGEGNHELIPVRGTEFRVKDLPGYAIEFKSDESGRVVEAVVRTRIGVFTARRR